MTKKLIGVILLENPARKLLGLMAAKLLEADSLDQIMRKIEQESNTLILEGSSQKLEDRRMRFLDISA